MEPGSTAMLNDSTPALTPGLSADDRLLRERLCALPLESPPSAAWAELRRRLPANGAKPRRSTPWWFALAASLALLALTPSLRHSPVSPAAMPAPELSALMQRSQALESEIRGLRATSGDVADLQFQWESAIESDLALVDVGLAARSDQSEPLWRERVRLLEELKTATQMDSGPLLLQARMD